MRSFAGAAVDKKGDGDTIAAVRQQRRRYVVDLRCGGCGEDILVGWLAPGRILPSEQNSDGSQQDRLPTDSAQGDCPKIADMICSDGSRVKVAPGYTNL